MAPEMDYMVDDIEKLFWLSDPDDQEIFKRTKFQDLILFHNTLGRFIRNRFDLWRYEWKPLLIDGIDCSENHPDAVSMRVIEQVWKRVV